MEIPHRSRRGLRSRGPALGAPASSAAQMARLLLIGVLLAAASGCISSAKRVVVFDDGHSQVLLRSERGSGPYQHPATIAPVRMAHILSRIDLRSGTGPREPAVPTQLLYSLGEQISKALSKAQPNQEVVVQAVERTKRMGIFDRYYLTSLLVYMRGDLLHVQVGRVNWEIPPRREERLPETRIGEFPLQHRLLPDTAMTLVDPQTVAVQWRDPVFRKPTRTRMTPGGRIVRREVLLETAEDTTEFAPAPNFDGDLSPEQLRDLADLEEERRRGAVTETEYTSRRGRILGTAGMAPASDPAEKTDVDAPDAGEAEPE